MAESKPFRKLSVKLVSMLALAAVLFFLVGTGVRLAGGWLISGVYCSESRRADRAQEIITSLRDYVRRESIQSTDLEGLGKWNLDYPYVELTVQAGSSMVYTNNAGGDLLYAQNGLLFNYRAEEVPAAAFTVNFRNGAYLVELREFSEQRLYNLVDIAALTMGAMCFLLVMLQYNRRVTSAVTRLAKQVRQVSKGDLALEIAPTSQDEIGGLALDVDAMRLSILEKLRREEAAWQANTELITAISHDVRTPLTTLMGYLEVLRTREDLTDAQREDYLRLCGTKAEKLKELTDELFSYFLVFGKPEPDAQMEVFDADMLLEQVLGESAAELEAGGFPAKILELPEKGKIRVDMLHLRRVLDNLFSNISKYADPECPVELSAQWQGDDLMIAVSNRIRKCLDRPESTKIGLQTCEKLLAAMGGSFRRLQTAETFTAVLQLPKAEVDGELTIDS